MISKFDNVFTTQEIWWMNEYMERFDGWQLIFDDSTDQGVATYSLGRAIDKPNYGDFEDFLIKCLNSRIKSTVIPDFHRVVYNAFRPGDSPALHIDGEYNGALTAMVYTNLNWKPEWGGETVFYKDGECIDTVVPKPGRVIMFPGNIKHGAKPPSVLADAPARFSVALQFCPGQDEEMEYHAQFQSPNHRPFPPIE